jgi:hypothetical protein
MRGTGTRRLTRLGGLTPQPGGPVLLADQYLDLSTRRVFVDTWDRVWARLPRDVQRAIAAHWRSPVLRAEWGRPTVRLVASLPSALAHATDHGMTLRVRVGVLTWDRAWLAGLLAHELAHVWQAATTGRVGASVADAATDEHDARWLCWSWGLPPVD